MDAGFLIVEKFISWVEGLDAKARAGVGGISLMNEPGNGMDKWVDHRTVLGWVAKAGAMFRKSNLPSRGVKLYVNVIQMNIPDFYGVLEKWWESTFSEAERNLWAVLDIHNYLAWRDDCKGHHKNVTEGGYTCDEPIEQIQGKIRQCLEPFFQQLATMYKGLRASGEFSLATDYNDDNACRSKEILSMYLTEQVELQSKYGLEPFFWSWKMPYSPKKEPAWSYQYHAGLAKAHPLECFPHPWENSPDWNR